MPVNSNGKMVFEGEPGTKLYCFESYRRDLQRIASALEDIAACLKNNNPSSH